MNKFSDYIVYVDESGDHSLSFINKDYPLFVLAFCIFHKDSYKNSAVKKLKEFKFKHFGHDMVVLHENDIRRDRGDFKFLKSKKRKNEFIEELTQIIEDEEFTVISTVIRKNKLVGKYVKANNPYNIALKFCLERLYWFISSKKQEDSITHIIVEQRGKNEDMELELEFYRICQGANYLKKKLPFEIIMANKHSNSAGLQLADLVARPIGLNILKPIQKNRAYEIIKQKFYTDKNGKVERYGLKIFP